MDLGALEAYLRDSGLEATAAALQREVHAREALALSHDSSAGGQVAHGAADAEEVVAAHGDTPADDISGADFDRGIEADHASSSLVYEEEVRASSRRLPTCALCTTGSASRSTPLPAACAQDDGSAFTLEPAGAALDSMSQCEDDSIIFFQATA